jgi:uncharacterized membrane protein YdjX (TVP38/TMEM64 family)
MRLYIVSTRQWICTSHCKLCFHLQLQDLEELIASSGAVGPLIFVGAYAAATVLLFPASLLTLGAGYLFGAKQDTTRGAKCRCSHTALYFNAACARRWWV